MFLPIKADFTLPRFPVLTLLVCVICAGVFMKQISDWKEFNYAVDRFCMIDRSRIAQMVFQQIEERERVQHCAEIMYLIDSAPDSDEVIEQLVSEIRPLAGYDYNDSQAYVAQMLNDELHRYRRIVPPDPDQGLAYYSASWNPIAMMTSTFAHGGWGHIIFNLIFFVAFAMAVEAVIGPLMYIAAFTAIALFTGIFSSVSAMATGNEYWTLGLSGVVMGMMGLFTFLMPLGRIRCFYFFIVIFGTIAVPAWALTLWYVGGDIYRLFAVEDNGVVNVMAHVTGGIGGYLFGALFLRKAKIAAKVLQDGADPSEFRPAT